MHICWSGRALAGLLFLHGAAAAPVSWPSPHHYRAVLSIDQLDPTVSDAPAELTLDLTTALQDQTDTVDERSLAVFTSNQPAQPLPHRVERYFGSRRLTLHLVVPDLQATNILVYFDTVKAGLATPTNYSGIVGNGDRFVEQFGRRNIAPTHFDQFVDFDQDGDLDLFRGGVEPFVYCYENVGTDRLVERGRLTSAGQLLRLPASESNRSWVTVCFHDMDEDGDQDFFPSFNDGPERGHIVCYRNTTPPKGQLQFERIGLLETESGQAIPSGSQAGGWFPSLTWVKDWDEEDGSMDALVGSNNHCWLYRSRSFEGRPRLAEPIALQAGGADIELSNPRFAAADADGDGDLDLFAGTQPGPVFFYKNIGTRFQPILTNRVAVAWTGRYLIADAHSGLSVADWNGDGLLDVVTGRFWERTNLEQPFAPRTYGGFFANVKGNFELQPEAGPYTEQFQICDAIRQNSVRAFDLDRDGRLDLLAGDTDGFVWFFRNTTNQRFPVFAPGQKLQAGSQPLSVASTGGHARLALVDYDSDGHIDLIVADGAGTVQIFPAAERSRTPLRAFSSGKKLLAGGTPLRVGARASVLACDWDNDGLSDLVLADEKGYYFAKNIGSSQKPDLAAPTPILFGGKPVTYVRPNLGAFVDWDGDGNKDLIAAQFENSLRFYRNAGTGQPGDLPRFDDPEGKTILQAESPQLISGVEVVDWNGDGDLDILTGQGHGASGLRFYERDWLELPHPHVRLVGIETKTP